MKGDLPGKVRELDTAEDERGVEVPVARIEVDDGQEFMVFDSSGELSGDLVGEEVDLALMALVEDASRSGIPAQATTGKEKDPYYCLIGGTVVDRGLEEDGDDMISLLTLDIGPGTILVRFEDQRLYRKIRNGETIHVLSNKIDLLEVID